MIEVYLRSGIEFFVMIVCMVRREKERAAYRKYYKANSEKVKAKNRAWQKANPEKANAKNRAWYEANADKVMAAQKAYKEANIEKTKAAQKVYYKANPEKFRLYATSRRAVEYNSEGSLEFEDYFLIFEKHDYKCPYCNADVQNNFHLDHIVPLTKGGSSWVDNFQALCPFCNLSKKDKMPWDYEEEINFQRPPNFYNNPKLYSGELN